MKGNNELQKNELKALDEVRKIIKEEKDQIAAVILEPLVQGAVGMKICRKRIFVRNCKNV